MSMYAFKEETITALGDAVRKQVGETRPKAVTSIVYENVDMADYPYEDYAITSGKYTYVTEPIALPHSGQSNTGYYMVTCEGLDVQGDSYITLTVYGKSGDKMMAGMAIAVNNPVRLNSYNVSSGDRTVTLSFGVATTDYENGITPKAAKITITPYTSDGSAIEWNIPIKNTMTVAEMATKIDAFPPVPTENDLVFSGQCIYTFANDKWNWVIEKYGDLITTENISAASNMFGSSKNLKNIPFALNFSTDGKALEMMSMFSGCHSLEEIPDLIRVKSDTYADMSNLFQTCRALTKIGKISGFYPGSLSNMFSSCERLRELPVIENMNYNRLQTYVYSGINAMFNYCNSLRKIPESFIKEMYGIHTSSYNNFFHTAFTSCFALDEITGLVGCASGTAWTSNMFNNTFANCYHLKRITFAMNDDGTPMVQNWKNQTIDLTQYVGYAQYEANITNYNSGLTTENKYTTTAEHPTKPVGDDWWSNSAAYSRYTLESIIETINSLPDCSASGGTNTIKFKKSAGNGFHVKQGSSVYVPQCASQLTEAQIAVAAAKGWTVTLVD